MGDLCLLDGRVQPVEEARISPLDRGFLFGDAIYEVVKVLEGRPLFAAAHWERLRRNLDAVEIPEPADLPGAAALLLAASGLASGGLYVQVTRGVAPRSHRPPRGLAPTLLMLPLEKSFASDPTARSGLRARIVDDLRWGRADLKSTSLQATVLARLATNEDALDEVLFRGPRGELREGGNTSLFVRSGGVWWTPPLDRHLLPGITRRLLLDAFAAEGWPAIEREIVSASISEWEEAFLCGTLTGVRGLVEVDGMHVGGGRVGDATLQAIRALSALELRERPAQP